MRFCQHCGGKVTEKDIFCGFCGKPLPPVVAEKIENMDDKHLEETQSKVNLVVNQTDLAIRRAIGLDFSTSEEPEKPAEKEEKPPAETPANQIETPENIPPEQETEADEPATVVRRDFSPFTPEAANPLPELILESESPEKRAEDFVVESDAHDDLPPTLIGNPPPEFYEPPQVSENIAAAPELLKESAPESTENSIPSLIAAPEIGDDEREAADLPTENKIAPPVETPRPTESNKPQNTPNGGGKAAKLKTLDDGTLLNRRYKIVRRIGGGGMGAVYLAEDQNLGGVLRAVKEMIQAYIDESQQEKAVADFRRESLLLTSLEHPAIPTIYDYFYDEVNGRFYLVMKYISGGDLAARLRSAPEGFIDERSVTEWAIQVADVLSYLHNHNPPIVYRDLKPSNVMLDGNSGKAMLIDFGIARWVNKEEKGVTAVGTMGYAPPELFSGNAEPRSDIYSLGATMFHLVTGADPQSNPLLIFDFAKNKKPRQLNSRLSVEMEDILLRAVEYNSNMRFESATKMRDALQQHLEQIRGGKLTYERAYDANAFKPLIPSEQKLTTDAKPFAQPNMVFCGFCGEKIIANDSFCAYCGAPQQNAPGASATLTPETFVSAEKTFVPPPENVGTVTARLIVLGTNQLDAPSFALEKETNLVGREDRRANIFPEIDLSKFDAKAQVSRRHARIWREGAQFLVEDLKSSNGTVIISETSETVRLQANQPHVLHNGDQIKLGETVLKFYEN